MNKKLRNIDCIRQSIYSNASKDELGRIILTPEQTKSIKELDEEQNEIARLEGENRYALYRSVCELDNLGFEYDEILQMVEDMYDLDADRKWVFKNN